MPCNCGEFNYYETGSGGVRLSGSAIVSCNAVQGSGGLRASATGIISSNLLWDGFDSVYHLTGSYNATANEVINSLGRNHGTGDKGILPQFVPTQAAGVWDQSQLFGGNQYISLPHDFMANFENPITVSCWARITGKYQERTFYSRGFTDQSGKGWNIVFGHDESNHLQAKVQVIGASNWKTYSVLGETVLTDCWQHVALIWLPSTSATVYLNGFEDGSTAIPESTLVPTGSVSYLGRNDYGRYAKGYIQEFRLRPYAVSESVLQAETANLCDNSHYTLTTVGVSYEF